MEFCPLLTCIRQDRVLEWRKPSPKFSGEDFESSSFLASRRDKFSYKESESCVQSQVLLSWDSKCAIFRVAYLTVFKACSYSGFNTHLGFHEKNCHLHPGRLTWNLQITHLERNVIFQTSMINMFQPFIFQGVTGTHLISICLFDAKFGGVLRFFRAFLLAPWMGTTKQLGTGNTATWVAAIKPLVVTDSIELQRLESYWSGPKKHR